MREDLITTREACDRLRISRGTLHRLIRDGELVPIRFGRRRNYYQPADLDAFVAALSKRTTPAAQPQLDIG